MKNITAQRIMEIAGRIGSTANTTRGLLRYAKTHPLPEGMRGDAPSGSALTYLSRGTGIGDGVLHEMWHRLCPQRCASTHRDSWYRSRHAATGVAHVHHEIGLVRYRGAHAGRTLGYSSPGVYARPMRGGDVQIVACSYTGGAKRTVRVAGRSVPHLTVHGLVTGDVYGVERHAGIVERYAMVSQSRAVRVGYAVRVGDGWEHGATIAEIRAEIEHKRTLAAIASPTVRQARAARLIARIPGLRLTRAAARAIGYCDAGIRGFLRSIGQPEDAEAVDIRSIPAGADSRWRAVRERVAIEIAVARW